MESLIFAAEARDSGGPIALVRRVAADAEGHRTLELEGARPPVGAITLRYRARSVPTSERGAREGLRHDATGIGGLGAHFLVLPESERPRRVRVVWAPASCPADPRGERVSVSSFGTGPVAVETTLVLDRLRSAAYFAGHPTVTRADDGSMHVRAAWFGAPAFDPGPAGEWAARAFLAERAFFRDADPAPYWIFVRVLASMGDRSNGMGQPSSFLSAIGPETPFGPRLRSNIAHEMLHRWIGLRLRLAGPDGANFWFTEGFTVHYASALMLRAGLVTPDEFLSALDDLVTRHFSNPHVAATNEEIRRGFFDDDALSVVPYTRGALYAAELDAAIRRTSGGARSLDDVVRELYAAVSSEPETAPGVRELPEKAFRDAVLRELGPAGADRFDAVIARGGTPEPPAGAYGPCFLRERRAIPIFELGFDERASLGDKAIRKLVAGSAAAKAGLREGDELVSLSSSLLFPDKPVIATVARGKRSVVVRYLPARPGPKRDGFTWTRDPSVPDLGCVSGIAR